MIAYFSRIVLAVMLLSTTLLLGWSSQANAKDLAIAKPVQTCESLANSIITLDDGTPVRLASATEVKTIVAPPYCSVKGYVAPQVGFEMHLPTANWHQRFLYTGCGGFCGQANIWAPASDQCPVVQNGEMATIASDLGHSSSDVSDAVWASNNTQAKKDFGYRGVHVVTLAAKAIIKRFYGQTAVYSYYTGCSDGGREGMMEAQRYPEDFNGIIIGAPVIDETTNNTLYHAWIFQHAFHRDGTPVFSDSALKLLHAAALKACGATTDTSPRIADPQHCKFDPQILACGSTISETCLTVEQVADARALYSGPVDGAGKALYFGFMPGSELTWNDQATGSKFFATNFISYIASEHPASNFDLWSIKFNAESLRELGGMAPILDATDPDVLPFRDHGGKLMVWHGWADTGVPPMSTVTFTSAISKLATKRPGSDFMRLYMLPGVYHCGGGGPDRIDLVTPMMAWVEDGIQPGAVTATARLYGRVTTATQIDPSLIQ